MGENKQEQGDHFVCIGCDSKEVCTCHPIPDQPQEQVVEPSQYFIVDLEEDEVVAMYDNMDIAKRRQTEKFGELATYITAVYPQQAIDTLQSQVKLLKEQAKKDTIILSGGEKVLVDPEDYISLMGHHWFLLDGHGKKYVRANFDGKEISMHRFILGVSGYLFIDHINGNGLDNRKENLRFCTQTQNQHNRGASSASKTGYKGVFWSKANKRYIASITANKKQHHLGSFTCKHKAALAYNKKARELHGEFAFQNVITQALDVKERKE